jgi:type VI protein secretion system component Hcp
MADQLDAFMRLKGIDGESTDGEFTGKKVFELISFSISPDAQTITLKKPSDLSTAMLHQKYCLNFGLNSKTEKWISAGRLWVRKDCGAQAKSALNGVTKRYPGSAYLIFDFRKLSVKKFDWSVSDSGVSEDDITLSFEGLLMKYRPQKADGSLGTFNTGAWHFSEKSAKAMTECTDGEIF